MIIVYTWYYIEVLISIVLDIFAFIPTLFLYFNYFLWEKKGMSQKYLYNFLLYCLEPSQNTWHEFQCVLTCNWFYTWSASFGEQLSETISTVWFFVSGRETLSSQRRAAMATREAFPVPRFVFICNATTSNNL